MQIHRRRPPVDRPRPRTVGIYVDDVYRVDAEGRVSVDRAFLLFACEVGRRVGETVLFGRAIDASVPADYALGAVRLVRLPHYANLREVAQVARATLGTTRAFWRGLRDVDVVWAFGPHPFALMLAALALLRGRRVVLGIRQDTVAYARTRAEGRVLLFAGAVLLDRCFRLLARRLPTTVVGEALARRYGVTALAMTVTLVPERAVAHASRPPRERVATLLAVGRLEVEKNPLLLVEALAELERRRPGGQRLVWVGRGPLEADVRDCARRLGVDHLISLRGYVPFGDELLNLYRQADVLVHVSLTEGVPQVLIEAVTAGTPIVATAVGGVAYALREGELGILVPPGDRDALVAGVQRVLEDEQLRARLEASCLDAAPSLTIEAEAARVARYVAGTRVANSSS